MNYTSNDLFLERIQDYAEQSMKRNIFSRFLTEHEQIIAGNYLRTLRIVHGFDGGYEQSVRKMLFIPELDVHETNADYPITPLTILYDQFHQCSKISHRDVLGTIMGLQINRDTIGDIILGEGFALIFVLNSVCDCILSEISKIGRTPVKVILGIEREIPEQKFNEINFIVPSTRLDAVISKVCKLSREKSQILVKSSKVCINGILTDKYNKVLSEGDIISVRGYGKFIFEKINSYTKKSNMSISLKIYI